jgi:hypothetical protein
VPSDAGAGWADLRAALEADLRRVGDRMSGLSAAQLAAPVPPHGSRASAARHTAGVLAVAAQGVEERAGEGEPVWRPLPVLADFAVADQVAVMGHDLALAMGDVAPETPVWAPGGRRTALEVLSDAAEALAATRRLL